MPIPPDGRNLFKVLADELSLGPFDGADVIATFVERCTAYDTEWDDEDEWNEQVLKVQEFLRESPGAVSGLAKAKAKQSGSAAASLAAVLLRLSHDKKTQVEVAVLPWWRRLYLPLLGYFKRLTSATLGWPQNRIPDVSSVNTRVQCAVCQNYTSQAPVVCSQCNDANYCCQEHLDADRGRHGTWCFEPRGGKDTKRATSTIAPAVSNLGRLDGIITSRPIAAS